MPLLAVFQSMPTRRRGPVSVALRMPYRTRRPRVLARYVHPPSVRTSHRRHVVPYSHQPVLMCHRVAVAVVDRRRCPAGCRGHAHPLSMNDAACSSARETVGRDPLGMIRRSDASGGVGAAKFAQAACAVGDAFVAAGQFVDVAGTVGRAVVW